MQEEIRIFTCIADLLVLGRVLGPVDGLALLSVDGVALGLVDGQVDRLAEDVLADVVPTEGREAAAATRGLSDDNAGNGDEKDECRLSGAKHYNICEVAV